VSSNIDILIILLRMEKVNANPETSSMLQPQEELMEKD